MRYEGQNLRELLAAEYVLGLLHGGARSRFERLLMEDAPLRREVTAWEQRFTAWTATLAPVEPPGYLWWRLHGRLRRERQPRRAVLRNTFWRTWAVAATLVLAVILIGRQFTPPVETKPAAVALVSSAQGQPLWLISVHPEANRIDMKAIGDQTPPPGKSYELWMLPGNGNPVPMGLMNPTGEASETVTSALLAHLTQAKGLAISLEPAGGSPTGQPTGRVLWTAALVSA